MNPEWRKYAPIAFYVAVVAGLATIGIYTVTRTFELPVQLSLGICVIALALNILLDPQKVKEIFTGRQARYGSNTLVMVLAFIGIVVTINYISFNNSFRWDLTENKEHTLAPETIETLSKLKSPVTAQAFFTSNIPKDTATKLLENYKAHSKGNFNYKFIDPNADPVTARAAQITTDGAIILTMGDLTEQVSYADEQSMTGALIRLLNPGSRAVYFLTGHGEFIPGTSDANRAYTQINGFLTAKNYTVNNLDLLNSNMVIPEDALVLIIAGPMKSITEQEIIAIITYLDQGGSLIYLSEPPATTDFTNSDDVMGKYLSQYWGIDLDNDIIIDVNPTIMPASSNLPLFAISDTQQYGSHPITQRLMGMYTIFPTARSLTIGSVPAEVTQTTLVNTSEQEAWGETDIEALKNSQASPDPLQDKTGTLIIGIAAVNSQTKARVVVLGDADFVSDNYMKNFSKFLYGNTDLFVNAVDWSAEQENLLNLTIKQATERSMKPLQQTTIRMIMLGVIFVLPGAVIVLGIVVWIRRRMRG